jgi:hypothetical protein
MAIAIMVIVALVIAGAPAFATSGQPGPTPPRVGDPVVATLEVQSVVIGNGPATGGTFSLSIPWGTPISIPNLAYNVSNAALESAIETALNTAFGAGSSDVSVTATRGISYVVTFDKVNNLIGDNVPQMTAVGALTGPLAPYAITIATRQDGAGAVAGQVSPHNGYSSATDYCMQCHAVHAYQTGPGTYQGGGEYALLQGDSVTDTCNTCHALFGGTAAGWVDSDAITGKPTIAGGMGTTSLRSAYDLAGAGGTIPAGVSGHGLGADNSPLPDGVEMRGLGWRYGSFNAANWYLDNEAAGLGTASASDGGLYCGSCHTPHGEFGQLINSTRAQYRSQAGADAANAVQYAVLEGVTGTWTLTFAGQTTAALANNVTTADLDTALEGLSTIGSGNVTVAGTAGSYYSVTFGGTMVSATQPQFEGSATAGTVTIVTQQGGSAAVAVSGNTSNGTLASSRTFGEGKPIFQYAGSAATPTIYYLHLDTDPIIWEKCSATSPAAIAGGPDTGCSYLTTTDSEGQTVYLYGYKLLSAYPNHNWLKAESWGLGYRGTDQARWCGACHTSKTSPDFGVEGEYAVDVAGVPTTFHSHPTACNYCHGSPSDGSSADFPHTSGNGALLKEYPDALCLACHTQGSLP